MRCKFCGKELNDRQRFCDNCGRTVRHIQNSGQRQQSQRPQRPVNDRRVQPGQQRPNANRRPNNNPDSVNRYNKYMRDKQRKARELKLKKLRFRRMVTFVILLAVIIAVIGAVVAFNATKNADVTNINFASESATPEAGFETASPMVQDFVNGEEESMIDGQENELQGNSENSSASPTAKTSASPSASQKSKGSASPTAKSSGNLKEGYSSYKEVTTGIYCPYPSEFEKSDSTSTATKVSVTDGKAEMRINTAKVTTQDTAQSLLKSYSSGIGVEPTETSSADGVYSISFTRNGKYNRRTGVVYEGRHLYYDFSCPSDATSNSDYKSIIDYADEQLKKQIEKLNSEE